MEPPFPHSASLSRCPAFLSNVNYNTYTGLLFFIYYLCIFFSWSLKYVLKNDFNALILFPATVGDPWVDETEWQDISVFKNRKVQLHRTLSSSTRRFIMRHPTSINALQKGCVRPVSLITCSRACVSFFMPCEQVYRHYLWSGIVISCR